MINQNIFIGVFLVLVEKRCAMNRAVLLIMAALAALPAAFGFSDWIAKGDNFTIGGSLYTLRATGTDDNTLIIDRQDGGSVVLLFNESVVWRGYEFTFSDTKSSLDDYVQKYNISGGVHTIGESLYLLLAEEYAPAITASKTISRKEIAYFDEFSVTYTFRNDGEAKTEVSYREELPVYYRKTGNPWLKEDDNKPREISSFGALDAFEWKATILPGKIYTVNQTMQLVGVPDNNRIEFNLGRVTYLASEGAIVQQIEQTQPSLRVPLGLEAKFSSADVMVGDAAEIQLSLLKKTSEELIVHSLVCVLSENVVGHDTGGLSLASNSYSLSGALKENKTFAISFDVRMSGNISLKCDAEYVFRGMPGTVKIDKGARALINRPKISLEVPAAVGSRDNATISLSVDNKGTGYVYNDIDIRLVSDWFEVISYPYPVLREDSRIEKEFPIRAPVTNAARSMPVTLRASYVSLYGEEFTDELVRAVSVRPGDFEPALSLSLSGSRFGQRGNATVVDVNLSVGLHEDVSAKSITLPEHSIGLKDSEITHNMTVPLSVTFAPKAQSAGVFIPYTISYVKDFTPHFYSGSIEVRQASGHEAQSANVPKTKDKDSGLSAWERIAMKKTRLDTGPAVIAFIILVIGMASVVGLIALMKAKRNRSGTRRDMPDIESTEQFLEYSSRTGKEELAGPVFVPEPTTDLSVLEQYIKEKREAGHPREKIKQDLVKTGWLADIVDVYLK